MRGGNGTIIGTHDVPSPHGRAWAWFCATHQEPEARARGIRRTAALPRLRVGLDMRGRDAGLISGASPHLRFGLLARGFTMVETIVVVVLLSVAAGLIATRMRFDPDRRGEAEAARVASLLESAAARAAFTAQKTCVRFERGKGDGAGGGGRLAVEVALPTDRMNFDVQEVSWAPDSLEPTVNLEHTTLERSESDGFPLDPGGWRIEFEGSGRQSGVEIVLKSTETNTRWTVVLASHAPRAAVLTGPVNDATDVGESIDLDGIGLGDAAW